tara:strand:+ start:1277 stop:4228 length:2952 start_codon:yes stop_codon:yes gene_type:complete
VAMDGALLAEVVPKVLIAEKRENIALEDIQQHLSKGTEREEEEKEEEEEVDTYSKAIEILEQVHDLEQSAMGRKISAPTSSLIAQQEIGEKKITNKNDIDQIMMACALNYQENLINDAEKYCKIALRKIEELKGIDHPEVADILDYLALISLAKFQSNQIDKDILKSVESYYNRSLKIRLKENKILKIARSYHDIGYVYSKQGNFRKAEISLLKALEIRENNLNQYDKDLQITILSLAIIYTDLGDYEKAKDLSLRSLAISKFRGCTDELCINTLNTLGSIYDYLGQTKKSIDTFHKALSIARQNLDSNNQLLLVVQQNLENLKPESITYKDKIKPNNKSQLQKYLDKGYGYELENDFQKASIEYEKALLIQENILGVEHPDTARTYIKLALQYWRLEKHKESEFLYNKGLKIIEDRLGKEHIEVLHTLVDYSLVYLSQAQYEKATALLKRAIKLQTLLIQKNVQFMSIDNREAYINKKLGDLYKGIFTSAHQIKPGAILAMYARLNRHGLLEEIQKKQAALTLLSDPQKDIAEEISKVITQMSNTNLTKEKRNNLLSKRNNLESQLYKALPKLQPRIVEVNQIANVLPEKSILIEYQRYLPFDWSPSSSQAVQIEKGMDNPWQAARYVALVLKPNGEVQAIDLGLATSLEEKIQSALVSSEEGLDDAQSLWSEISELVIKPLAQATAGSTTWFISPDAELNRIPFAALSSTHGNSLLIDDIKLRLLTTGRELLDLTKSSKSKNPRSLVVANPSFNYIGNNNNLIANSSSTQQRSGDLTSKKWRPLPGTEQEGKAIARLITAQVLTKNKATVLAIQKGEAPKVLHIASHAYFLTDQNKVENPLLRSGIVLAGANHPDANPNDDGYLTALEVAKLDWHGTEMVVISGCDSGKGDIKAGEGVYGLRRAIAVAGARSSLLSLWKVDDEATAAFMESFYQRLKTGKGRADALAATQKEFRNHPTFDWRHPYVWAAFQLSGDWKQIKW